MNPYSFSYDYDFSGNLTPAEAAEILMNFFHIFITVMVIVLAISYIANYVMNGIALYRIAKKRNMDCAYLAWIPFASAFLFGKIIDDIQIHNGVQSKHRIFALLDDVAVSILGALNLTAAFSLMYKMFSTLPYWENGSYEFMSEFLTNFFVAELIVIICSLLALLGSVYWYVITYKLFQDYAPNYKVLYILLTIFISLSYPIILLVISGRQSVSLNPKPPVNPTQNTCNHYGNTPYQPHNPYIQQRFWK